MEQKKVDFMNEWLKGVFTFIKGKKLESSIIKFGHMSYHVFAHRDPANKLSLSHFIRIMINLAMLLIHTEKKNEFMDLWIELGHRLQDFAEGKYADAFNQQFSSDNNTK
jgi:hypothetical protein